MLPVPWQPHALEMAPVGLLAQPINQPPGTHSQAQPLQHVCTGAWLINGIDSEATTCQCLNYSLLLNAHLQCPAKKSRPPSTAALIASLHQGALIGITALPLLSFR